MEQFEKQLQKDLHQFLLSMKEVDERLPECLNVEEKWGVAMQLKRMGYHMTKMN